VGGLVPFVPFPTFVMSKLFRVRFQYGMLVPADTPEQAVQTAATTITQNPFAAIFGAEVASFEAKSER